jgi:hypothetical protein
MLPTTLWHGWFHWHKKGMKIGWSHTASVLQLSLDHCFLPAVPTIPLVLAVRALRTKSYSLQTFVKCSVVQLYQLKEIGNNKRICNSEVWRGNCLCDKRTSKMITCPVTSYVFKKQVPMVVEFEGHVRKCGSG